MATLPAEPAKDIVVDETIIENRHAPKLGLIGGLGVGATVHYYRLIAEGSRLQGRTPALLIAHADVDRVLVHVRDGQLSELAAYLAGLADELSAAGADLGAIAAVTPHICLAEMARLTRLPLVDLIAETVLDLKARGLRRITLFGTRFSIESRLFGRLGEFDVVMPQPAEVDRIHAIYTAIVQAGRGLPEHRAELSGIAHTLRGRDGVEAVVLAGTELALVFDATNTDFPAVDCARVHVDALLRRMAPDAG